MSIYVERAGLRIDEDLAGFIENEALPGTGVDKDAYWAGLADLVSFAMPRNAELLAVRETLQKKIDDWHKTNGPVANDSQGYEAFLKQIGYLEDEPDDFQIETEGLDPEITKICGPQLVVPVSNPRYALNAANARWGSLYDALYGTDVIPRDGTLQPRSGLQSATRRRGLQARRRLPRRSLPAGRGQPRRRDLLHRRPDRG